MDGANTVKMDGNKRNLDLKSYIQLWIHMNGSLYLERLQEIEKLCGDNQQLKKFGLWYVNILQSMRYCR